MTMKKEVVVVVVVLINVSLVFIDAVLGRCRTVANGKLCRLSMWPIPRQYQLHQSHQQ